MQNITKEIKTKSIVILIGPLGVGKTKIGSMLSDIFGIKLLETDSIFRKYRNQLIENFDELGYQEISKIIEEYFLNQKQIIIESTGASKYFINFLDGLKAKYKVILIKINAPLELVQSRVKTRNKTRIEKHEPSFVEKVYNICNAISLEYDYKIENLNEKDLRLSVIEINRIIKNAL